jgi:Arf-GAP/Rho-GAP domain/ANK repeat/PH domain-containing protein 3
MYKALQARPVKGTTAAVCEIAKDPGDFKAIRIKDFSAFHNFVYDTNGLRASKAYDIGPGKLITWADLEVQGRSPIKINVIENQSFGKLEPRQMKLSPSSANVDKEEEIVFECNMEGCSLSFATADQLQDHISFAEHDTKDAESNEGLYDQLRREWALKFSILSADSRTKQTVKETAVTSDFPSREAAGWALQKAKGGNKRFSDNIRSYLTTRFDAGVTGRKADPGQVANDIRKARNDDGSRKFSREEWLTKTQVKSFFSRLSAAKRKQQSNLDDSDEEFLKEEHEYRKEENLQEEVNDIIRQLAVEHPIIYDGYDICDHVKTGLISKFTVKILKDICEYFDVPFKSRDTKAILISHISCMVTECSCFSRR